LTDSDRPERADESPPKQNFLKYILSLTAKTSKITSPDSKKSNVKSIAGTPRNFRGRSKVAPFRAHGKSILLTSEKRIARDEMKSKTKRLKKVHFNLPKAAKSRRTAQALDPKSPIVCRWLSIMLLPLSYEVWAFPYRLALGSPSLTSKICNSDIISDSFFVLDILVTLCTAIPAEVGGEAQVTSFTQIAKHYFKRTFPVQFLPCLLYWIATPICSAFLSELCSASAVAETHHRRSSSEEGRNPWDLAAGAVSSSESYWACVVRYSNLWPMWVWWLSTIPRLVPRLLRLVSYFKSMESDLVRIITYVNFRKDWV
jgi:hypothetical protein